MLDALGAYGEHQKVHSPGANEMLPDAIEAREMSSAEWRQAQTIAGRRA
jgi:hypothetical protein